MNVNQMLLEIIEKKYQELSSFKKTGIFEKITNFEGNAIGQIGEQFIKTVLKELGFQLQETAAVVHDEFDILLADGTKIEIKTARMGLKNEIFQFNGINPHYNYDYIFCIGLSTQAAYFKIINGKIFYDHKKRKFYLNVDDKPKQLVAMNPGNQANYKLTLSKKHLNTIENLTISICQTFKNKK